MAREMEAMDWLGLGSVGVALFALALGQSGAKSWAADRPISLIFNILAGLIGTAAALWSLYWPLVVLQGLWAIVSAFNLARVVLLRQDVRMAAKVQALKQ